MLPVLVLAVCWYANTAGRSNPIRYYVSIGDSYAAASGPNSAPGGSTSRDGFAYQVAASLPRDGSPWKLVNFACSGETAYAMAFDDGCASAARAPDGAPYENVPQDVAAADFISQHRDRIGLITIVMGANDVLHCLDLTDDPSARTCAEHEVPIVVMTLNGLLARIRADVGGSVPIVGLSYINVFLADALNVDPSVQRRASASTTLFKNYLNPALLQTYSKYGAHFVDTTALAGGYLPLTEKTWVPGYGTVTASIGRICKLTYYCTGDDVHPTADGHALIAGEVEKLARS
jgi:lysophospholipase L1-like esterase